MKPLLCCLVLLAVGCVAPTQHDPNRWGTRKIAFVTAVDESAPWLPSQLKLFEQELTKLQALGPRWVIVAEADADTVFSPFISGPKCARGTGRYTPAKKRGECDPDCCHGDEALQTCFGHEMGHSVGMEHVCQADGEGCSPVGHGVALMNPEIETSAPDGFSVSQSTPTALDLDEFRRVH